MSTFFKCRLDLSKEITENLNWLMELKFEEKSMFKNQIMGFSKKGLEFIDKTLRETDRDKAFNCYVVGVSFIRELLAFKLHVIRREFEKTNPLIDMTTILQLCAKCFNDSIHIKKEHVKLCEKYAKIGVNIIKTIIEPEMPNGKWFSAYCDAIVYIKNFLFMCENGILTNFEI